jgi:PhzF family phenazine biosynthesis protein
MTRAFRMVDVFGETALRGNPLGVVLDAEGLSTEAMQALTRWLNLSETTFLLPPTDQGADYRVRIFTLERELPFAGHPTLGSCHAWLEAGGKPRTPGQVVQECGAGLVPLRLGGGGITAFAAPPTTRSGPVEADKIGEICTVLRITPEDIVDAQWVDNGPGWVAVLLKSAEAVLALEPAREHASRLDLGVVGPHAPGSGLDFELRAIFSDQFGALREDPVTGSLNASVAQWLLASGRAKAPYLAAQGTALGCAGRIHISQDEEGQVWVGGASRTIVTGSVEV